MRRRCRPACGGGHRRRGCAAAAAAATSSTAPFRTAADIVALVADTLVLLRCGHRCRQFPDPGAGRVRRPGGAELCSAAGGGAERCPDAAGRGAAAAVGCRRRYGGRGAPPTTTPRRQQRRSTPRPTSVAAALCPLGTPLLLLRRWCVPWRGLVRRRRRRCRRRPYPPWRLLRLAAGVGAGGGGWCGGPPGAAPRPRRRCCRRRARIGGGEAVAAFAAASPAQPRARRPTCWGWLVICSRSPTPRRLRRRGCLPTAPRETHLRGRIVRGGMAGGAWRSRRRSRRWPKWAAPAGSWRVSWRRRSPLPPRRSPPSRPPPVAPWMLADGGLAVAESTIQRWRSPPDAGRGRRWQPVGPHPRQRHVIGQQRRLPLGRLPRPPPRLLTRHSCCPLLLLRRGCRVRCPAPPSHPPFLWPDTRRQRGARPPTGLGIAAGLPDPVGGGRRRGGRGFTAAAAAAVATAAAPPASASPPSNACADSPARPPTPPAPVPPLPPLTSPAPPPVREAAARLLQLPAAASAAPPAPTPARLSSRAGAGCGGCGDEGWAGLLDAGRRWQLGECAPLLPPWATFGGVGGGAAVSAAVCALQARRHRVRPRGRFMRRHVACVIPRC